MRALLGGVLAALLAIGCKAQAPLPPKPTTAQRAIGARRKPVLLQDGLRFKDANGNGHVDAYEDWRKPTAARVDDLVARMSTRQKAGLMVHASLQGFTGPNGELLTAVRAGNAPPDPYNAPEDAQDAPSPAQLVDRDVRWILVRPGEEDTPRAQAHAANLLQELGEASPLGIPVVLSTDPRHFPRRGFTARPGVKMPSAWPTALAFGALREPGRAQELGDVMRQELRATGIRVLLGPMADIASEPRWARLASTFGEDPRTVAELTASFVRGVQGPPRAGGEDTGPALGATSVMAVTKHFPGHGPVKDGLDPHTFEGRFQTYPAGQLEGHLAPFRAAMAARTGGIMLGYAIPEGIDDVGMGFSRKIVGELLRERLGYQGIVMTDWVRMMPWGLEKATQRERQRRAIDAGADQVGGENDPRHLVALAEAGTLPPARIDASARRLLGAMFDLGLFEDPYVDEAEAEQVVGAARFQDLGRRAQAESVVVLDACKQPLPAPRGKRIFAPRVDAAVVARFGVPAASPRDADLVVYRMDTPYKLTSLPGGRKVREGSLDYADATNAAELEELRKLAGSGVPVIVAVRLDRPAVLTPIPPLASALVVELGADDGALFAALFGDVVPRGRLPVALPRDIASVLAQKPDAWNDLVNPLFPLGDRFDGTRCAAGPTR